MSLESAIVIAAINGDKLSPKITESTKYKHWLTVEDLDGAWNVPVITVKYT